MFTEFKPTETMAQTAKRALSQNGFCGYTASGRARKISELKSLHLYDVLAMHNFFVRNSVYILSPDCEQEIRARWNLYGGEAGFAWCKKVISKERSRRTSAEDNSIMFSINMPNHPELLRIQNRLRKLLPAKTMFNNPETFHMTLCYIPNPPDDEILKQIQIGDSAGKPIYLVSDELTYFDTSDGYAIILKVQKSQTLEALQRSIYNQLIAEMGCETSPYSIPENYIPHITLAYAPKEYGTPKTDFRVNFSTQATMVELERWGEILEVYSLVF